MIEIVEFYPSYIDKNKIRGTLHVYLINEDMDMRGIYVNGTTKKMFFDMPFRYMIDEEGKKIKVPLLQFMSKDKHKRFIEKLKKDGRKYILEQHKELMKAKLKEKKDFKKNVKPTLKKK